MSDAITLTSPWWRTEQAAAYVQTSKKILYGEVKAGRLRAAKIAGRRELRFRKEYLDEWLERTVQPQEILR